MSVVIDGSSGITTNSGTVVSTTDATLNGLTVGKGGGSVSTNTAVGYQAINSNTTGSQNNALGYQALYNSNGNDNTAMGQRAAYSTTSGTDNSAFGSTALYSNSTGSYNTGLGRDALRNNTTASNNTAVGYQAGYSNTTNGSNTFVGYQSSYLSTGQLNVSVGALSLYNNIADANNAFGYNSLNKNTSGGSNAAFGHASAYNNTTGSSNTAIGYTALFSNTTASNNTAVGYQAGYTNSTGAEHTIVGYQAGYTTNTGGQTLFGYQSGNVLSGGSYNSFFGHSSGSLVTSGAKNTIIGRYTGNQGGLDIRTSSNYIVLSDGDGNPRIYVNSAGSMYAPGVYNTTAGVSSNLYVDSSGLFYRATSSLKYKTDVENATHGLADVLKLRPITYRGKAEVDVGKTYGGLLAEEVHDAGLTEFVQYADDGSPDALHYGNMVSLAFKAIQELKALVDAQATEIAELKAKVG